MNLTEGSRNGDQEGFKCSGKACRSTAGRVIADCVALCCCPCAVVNILTLAFVKVPYKVGRKCLRRMWKKRKLHVDYKEGEREREINLGWKREIERLERREIWEIEEEAERVWEELYEQLGHVGFGRVSFTHDFQYSSDNNNNLIQLV